MSKLLTPISIHFSCMLIALACARVASAENWPSWRGPTGNGISTETDLPIEWSRQNNVRWRAELPEPGNSTPIVWGDRVFITQQMDGGKRRTVLCLDRVTGQQLWQSGVDAVEMEPTYETNPYCAPSPVTDGERVIAWFGSSGLVAFDMDGKELWRLPLGRVDHVYGHGSSPVVYGDLCFLNFGPGSREFAVAVNKTTGDIVWRYNARLPLKKASENIRGIQWDIFGTWSTPILVDEQVIFCFRDQVTAFEPTSGKQIWTCKGLGPQMKPSPVVGEGVLVALGGIASSTLAVRLGGKGDVSQSHRAWIRSGDPDWLGTGVIHRGHLFVTKTNGIVKCIELESGKIVWQNRLSGSSGRPDTWSSLFLADGKIYVLNQSADVFVIEASPQYQLIATNSLGEHTNSTVVGSQGNLFIRTHEALWCIGE